MLTGLLSPLSPRARWGLGAGVIAIVAVTVAAGFWLMRSDDQVLFADLRPQDAASMIAELDRQKVPYRIGADGSTILVDGAIVHATRLKLMGKDMPLHGAAGFELFNNGDFGMTEFAQKINYQRALQGEITRTILSLSEVRDARVHLALPEEGLFKRSGSKPKASITLALKEGQALRADQVAGIQRLVAGAVPGIAAQDVTLVDQQGVALTRVAQEGEADTGSARLDLKRETEKLLVRKATEVLDRAFGAGQAMASVDVTLNMDQVRVTTEDVLGAPARAGHAPSGVVVREREVMRDVGTPLAGPQDSARASNSQREVEYQVGRRVEQVVTQPGTIRRLHVAAVVRSSLDEKQIEQARTLLTAAVGGIAERGDTIVVHSLKSFEPSVGQTGAVPMAATGPAPLPVAQTVTASSAQASSYLVLVLGAGVLLLLGVLALTRKRVRANRDATSVMTEGQRQAMLGQLRSWLAEEHRAGSNPAMAPRLPEGRP